MHSVHIMIHLGIQLRYNHHDHIWYCDPFLFQRTLPVPTRREQSGGRGPRTCATGEKTARIIARNQPRAR